MLVKNENSSFQEFLYFQPFLSSLAKNCLNIIFFLGVSLHLSFKASSIGGYYKP